MTDEEYETFMINLRGLFWVMFTPEEDDALLLVINAAEEARNGER